MASRAPHHAKSNGPREAGSVKQIADPLRGNKMTERILTLLRAVPRLLLPFVPWVMLCGVTCVLAALAIGVVHTNSARYHLTPWSGEPIFEGVPHSDGGTMAVSSTAAGKVAAGEGHRDATQPEIRSAN
jgi:hypothetical protein